MIYSYAIHGLTPQSPQTIYLQYTTPNRVTDSFRLGIKLNNPSWNTLHGMLMAPTKTSSNSDYNYTSNGEGGVSGSSKHRIDSVFPFPLWYLAFLSCVFVLGMIIGMVGYK